MSSVRLSLCMILKDEAFFLPRCLDAVAGLIDEMILVDTGSSDDTPEICRQYTDQVFKFTWVEDFSAARNYSIEQATGDWILVLDADEVIIRKDLEHLRNLIAETDADVFMLQQLNYSNDPAERDWQALKGQHLLGWDYAGFQANPIARLFRNRPDIRFKDPVHEIIDLTDKSIRVESLGIPIHHDIHGNPERDKAERQRRYLQIMEGSPEVRSDGRIAALAGATRMYYQGDYEGAIAHLEKAAELGYEREINLEAIAEAWYRLGKYDLARQTYADLHESGFSSASLCNNYSNLLAKNGEYARAIELLEEALALGQSAPQRIARIRHNIKYLKGLIQ